MKSWFKFRLFKSEPVRLGVACRAHPYLGKRHKRLFAALFLRTPAAVTSHQRAVSTCTSRQKPPPTASAGPGCHRAARARARSRPAASAPTHNAAPAATGAAPDPTWTGTPDRTHGATQSRRLSGGGSRPARAHRAAPGRSLFRAGEGTPQSLTLPHEALQPPHRRRHLAASPAWQRCLPLPLQGRWRRVSPVPGGAAPAGRAQPLRSPDRPAGSRALFVCCHGVRKSHWASAR